MTVSEAMNAEEVVILYATETGTAEDYAEEVWREGRRRGLACRFLSVDALSPAEFQSVRTLVVVVATAGQGTVPRSMSSLWKALLRRSLPGDWLSGLRFAVLGLGDSSYEKYNFAGKKLRRRLEALGAEELVPAAWADDQDPLGPDAAAMPWIDSLWSKLAPGASTDLPYESKYHVILEGTDNWKTATIPSSASNCEEPEQAVLLRNERLTAEDHFQDTRLLELESEAEYGPGAVAAVLPCNSQEAVSELARVLSWEPAALERRVRVMGRVGGPSGPPPWRLPSPTTLGEAARAWWDLSGTPKRSALRRLADWSPSELEKERLLELASPENIDDWFDYATRPRRTVLEVLEDFGETARSLTPEALFDIISPIRPRHFSIASAYAQFPGKFQLLVAVVKYKTWMKKPRLGLCSNWLASLKPGFRVPVWLLPGTFRLPAHPGGLVLVGPGTGLAPVRNVIYHYERQTTLPPTLLFFGCRSRHKDAYFLQEMTQLEEKTDGRFAIKCAFSRDQEEKIYVQHVIRDSAEKVWSLLVSGALVLVSGSSKGMPEGVREALSDIAAAKGENGADFLKALEAQGRLQWETWS